MRNPISSIVEQSSANFQESCARLMAQSVSPKQYARAVAFALESWPQSLHAISYPSTAVEMRQAEIVLFGKLWGETEFALDRFPTPESAWSNAGDIIATATCENVALKEIPAFDDLRARIETTLAAFRERIAEAQTDIGMPLDSAAFFRLGTTSPKDSPFAAVSAGRVENADQALLLMLTSNRASAQIANDEIMQTVRTRSLDPEDVNYGHPNGRIVPAHLTTLWLRVHNDFAEHQEFRCFMKAREFIGGTQYHGIVSDPQGRYFSARPLPELVAHGAEYEKLIIDWFPTFRDACPYDDAVFDTVVDRHRKRVTLLEVNPFAPTTFPGLMDWSNPQTFDGEVRWVVETIEYTAPKISAAQIEDIKKRVATKPAPPALEAFGTRTHNGFLRKLFKKR